MEIIVDAGATNIRHSEERKALNWCYVEEHMHSPIGER